MKRHTFTSLLAFSLLVSALVGCSNSSPANGGDGGSGAPDPYAAVRPYAEQALALATMEYGLALMAAPASSMSVNFGNFELDRHTVTWLGLLGVELSPSLPPHGTVTTLRSGDDDGDGVPWAVRSYALYGPLLGGGAFELNGAAGLGELAGDYSANTTSYTFDAATQGGPLTLEMTAPDAETVAGWSVAEVTSTSWTQSPDSVEYFPALLVDVERRGVPAGRVSLSYPTSVGPLRALLEPVPSTFSSDTLRVDPTGELSLQVSATGVSFGPVQLKPVVVANNPLLWSASCMESGTATAGFVSGKVYYVDANENAVAAVTVTSCGQYEVETFF